LLAFTLALSADRAADRAALLAADRGLTHRTEAAALAESAIYLYPGAPLLRGVTAIRTFLDTAASSSLTRVPLFADVSSDGTLGYTYGWMHAEGGQRAKYLACWRKSAAGWRIAASARSNVMSVPDSVPLPSPRRSAMDEMFPGPADSTELLRADSTFAALSRSQGAKTAFYTFASEDAIAFGGGPQLTEGRDAIAASFDGFPAGAVLEWWPLTAQIARSGDLGCTVGEAMIASLHHYSKYLTIWRRQRDGSWKFVADGGNPRPAPQR
jgi:ketosteroid isomerase-like protein